MLAFPVQTKQNFSAMAVTISNSILSFGKNYDLCANRLFCHFGASESAVVLQSNFSRFAANDQTQAALADVNS